MYLSSSSLECCIPQGAMGKDPQMDLKKIWLSRVNKNGWRQSGVLLLKRDLIDVAVTFWGFSFFRLSKRIWVKSEFPYPDYTRWRLVAFVIAFLCLKRKTVSIALMTCADARMISTLRILYDHDNRDTGNHHGTLLFEQCSTQLYMYLACNVLLNIIYAY